MQPVSGGDQEWPPFVAQEQAVIAFARTDDSILLIYKKRGLGHGKVNGPGGRLESGETPVDAALRETSEEVGLALRNPREHATLQFRFTDGYCLEVFVFVTREWSGEVVETDEAEPLWTPISEIPYDRMWADDRIWLPHVLADRYVEGRFIFDGDTMRYAHVVVREP
jgi:8-oxo-dGTP diphosphatase